MSVPIDVVHGLFRPRVFLEDVLFQGRRCCLVSQVLGVLALDSSLGSDGMGMGCCSHQNDGSVFAVCVLVFACFRVRVNILELSHFIQLVIAPVSVLMSYLVC